ETLLYILEKIGARPNIGEAVVCKLMYFIDFDYYEKFEEQLMGAKYIKNHFGPTPVAFPEIVKQMEKDGDLTPVVKKYFQHDQKKYLPRRKADLSNFSAREKELIDWEIERFKDFNATKIKEYSHKDVPWIGAENLQPIEYEAVFYRTDEFSVRQYDDDEL
ncbi:SocA family protein, partial [Candidatus Parcubacteria bacterium]|nr:SocA family protein [Candidatus Parcubacteria bacterium]